MNYFDDAELEAVIAGCALKDFPNEHCGAVIDYGEDGWGYVPCENTAENPAAAFRIDPAKILRWQKAGTLLAVVHSHPAPAPACPSMADMTAQAAMAVPWGIVPVHKDGADKMFWFGDQVPRAHLGKGIEGLIGLPYRHGVTDCYSLIRDYYREVCGISLPDQPRGWGALGPGVNEYDWYSLLHEQFGFQDVPMADARPGDSLLLQVQCKFVNHAAVIVDSGLLLHHPGGRVAWEPGRLSKRDTIARWLPFVTKVLRHRSVGPW